CCGVHALSLQPAGGCHLGETGCGKTRLVRFLARLMLPQSAEGVDNMLVLKVHGGTTERAIEDAVRRAERLARKNSRLVPACSRFCSSTSTNAVGLIKEVMCDRRLHGHPVDPDGCLRFVAACNPYRRHTDEMIDGWRAAGLATGVRKEETADRFGDLPMRHLVYRVRPMPLSLLLWDFGSLSSEAESQYALRMLKSGLPAEARPHADAVADAVCESQRFMRRCFSDESRFVSLAGSRQRRCGNEVPLPPGISKNGALRENVFMMVVCISLLLPPLSLWASRAAPSPLPRPSAPCCQRGKPQDEFFVAVVVLEEVGSLRTARTCPLKSLHPLLEDGCIEEAGPADEDSEESLPPECRKVAFVGILQLGGWTGQDERGLYVQRTCRIATSWWPQPGAFCQRRKIHKTAIDRVGREFFGLRDFFSLVKDSRRSATAPDAADGAAVTLRCATKNFGGLEEVDPVKEFLRLNGGQPDDAHRGLAKLVLDAGAGDARPRGALPNLAGFKALLRRRGRQSTVIFSAAASPHDQLYTKVCRDINKIKLAMERGETSLYDVLNQYYETCGGQRYVDLGLGTHRLKCKIHENFRIVVVADRDTVMDRFPIPLINRMEKHRLCLDSPAQFKAETTLRGQHSWPPCCCLSCGLSSQLTQAASCETVIDEAKLRLRVVQRLMLTASPDCYFRLAQDSPLLETAIDPESAAFRPRSAPGSAPSLRAPGLAAPPPAAGDVIRSADVGGRVAAAGRRLPGTGRASSASTSAASRPRAQFSDFLRAFVGGARAERNAAAAAGRRHAAASAGLVASAKHCIEGVALPPAALPELQSRCIPGTGACCSACGCTGRAPTRFRGFESGAWLSMHVDSSAAHAHGAACAGPVRRPPAVRSFPPKQLAMRSAAVDPLQPAVQHLRWAAFHEDPTSEPCVLEFLVARPGLSWRRAAATLAYDNCSLWLRHEPPVWSPVLESGP
uniref:AAA_5 domain-containing protein n=1 Tax=Macrostomum lignano TaxID=282301 RepID=A0A1I8F914_9PLAT